jgi:hypothetical protein
MKNKIIILILLIFVLPLVIAKVQFYQGQILIESQIVTLDVNGANGTAYLEISLVNSDEKENAVSLNFLNLDETEIKINGESLIDNTLTFNPSEKKLIQVSYNLEVYGEGHFKELKYNPQILFEGLYSSNKVERYGVKLILPEGINQIVSSSKVDDRMDQEEGRVVYYWEKQNIAPTSLNIRWNTLTSDLEVKRTANPLRITQTPADVEVSVVIKNTGTEILKNIVLEDSFNQGLFLPVYPKNEFEFFDGGRVLQWSKTIDSLNPGEEKEIPYTVRIDKGINVEFNPLRVNVDDSLVVISDKIYFELDMCGNGVCDYEFTFENELNCLADCSKNSEDGYCANPNTHFDIDCIPKKNGVSKSIIAGVSLILILLIGIIIFLIRKRNKNQGMNQLNNGF